MIKRIYILILIIIAFEGTSRAEYPHFSLGVKSWLAEWHIVSPAGDFRSHVGALNGPVAILRYHNVFIGASYLAGNISTPVTQSSLDALTNRVDTDFSVGYYLFPSFGLIGGYKYISFTFDIPAGPTSPARFTNENAAGPFGGIVGTYRLGQSGFALYGNLTYSWLNRNIESDNGSTTGTFLGLTGEVGLAYRMLSAPISFTEGFKYQNFQHGSGEASDTFEGIVFSATYTF